MAKILFDITATQQPIEWLNSHIVMEVSAQVFSYVAVNAEKKLLQLRIYELDARNQQELAEEVSGIISADERLLNAPQASFVYNFPESQLVPEEHFTEETGHDMVALFHGDLYKSITLSEKIEGGTQYNLFRVPAEVHQTMQRHFSNGRYWHYYSLWMQHARKSPDQHSYISVIFYPKRMLVAVTKEEQLQLLQSFNYEAAEDVGYHLLNICGQLHLSPEDTALLLSGMIDISSALYTEIFKYFGQVQFDTSADAATDPALEEYPSHFFSPLLKLAVCVS